MVYLFTKIKTIFRFWLHATWYEPPHDKTNKMTCAPSEDLDQTGWTGHRPSLIRVFTVHMMKHWVLSCPLSAQRILWSDWADSGRTCHFVGFVVRRLIYRSPVHPDLSRVFRRELSSPARVWGINVSFVISFWLVWHQLQPSFGLKSFGHHIWNIELLRSLWDHFHVIRLIQTSISD